MYTFASAVDRVPTTGFFTNPFSCFQLPLALASGHVKDFIKSVYRHDMVETSDLLPLEPRRELLTTSLVNLR
jgi:hypothetical protein